MKSGDAVFYSISTYFYSFMSKYESLGERI